MDPSNSTGEAEQLSLLRESIESSRNTKTEYKHPFSFATPSLADESIESVAQRPSVSWSGNRLIFCDDRLAIDRETGPQFVEVLIPA